MTQTFYTLHDQPGKQSIDGWDVKEIPKADFFNNCRQVILYYIIKYKGERRD